MHKKKLILIIPANFRFDEIFHENALRLNFEVLTITNFEYFNEFKYPNIYVRGYNFLRKVFLRDFKYKKKLQAAFYKKEYTFEVEAFTKNQKADYAIYIRPDLWPKDIIEEFTKHSKMNICYQWDGLRRFPDIKKYIHFFDKFFVFQPEDLDDNGSFLFSTNFYFQTEIENINNEYDFLYVGTYEENRKDFLLSSLSFFERTGKSYRYIIHAERIPDELSEFKKINFISKTISYKEMLNYVKRSKVIIDFQNNLHNGLSFRCFESIFYEKKLITTNSSVKNYDLYIPNNIFVLNDANWREVETFLNLPYIPVEKSIKEKYSFENWLNYILDIQPSQKIIPPYIVPKENKYGFSTDSVPFKYHLAVCCIHKNENKYLSEWVEYYLKLGVEHFYIYDNKSKISPKDDLKKFVDQGIITVIDFPGENKQLDAYNDCLKRNRGIVRWIGFFDIDEFVVPVEYTSLVRFLKPYEEYGGLGISWLVFGSNGEKNQQKNKTQVERFLFRSNSDFSANNHIKSIVQPLYTKSVDTNPHSFIYIEGKFCVNENFEKIIGAFYTNSVTKIQLNHYFCRSEEEFREKILRGYADHTSERTMQHFIDHDKNDVFDDKALHILKSEQCKTISLQESIFTILSRKNIDEKNAIKNN